MSKLRQMFEFEELDLTPRGIFDFFTAPTQGYPASVLRICMSTFALWKTFGNWINLDRYFTEAGVLPWHRVADSEHQVYSVLALAPENPDFVAWVVGMSGLFALSMLVGFWPRLSALGVFLVSVALMHRNPFIDNRGDHLFVLLMGLCVLLPLGNVWSLDAWFRKRKGRKPPPATKWSQRLMALQISYIYLYAFGVKFRAPAWHDGSALYHAFASPGLVEWPTELTFQPLLMAVAWGTILLEMLFPILVWNRPARPLCLALGIAFHLGIEITMRIPAFSTLMIISYASYLTDEEVIHFVRRTGLSRILPVPRAKRERQLSGGTAKETSVSSG